MLEGGPVHKAFSSCVDPDPRPCPMLKCHPPPRRHLTLNPTLHKFHPCLNSTPHSQGLFFFFFFLLFGWGSVLPCCCWFIYIFIFSNKSIIFLILFYSLYFVIVLLFLACSLPPFFFFFLLWFCFTLLHCFIFSLAHIPSVQVAVLLCPPICLWTFGLLPYLGYGNSMHCRFACLCPSNSVFVGYRSRNRSARSYGSSVFTF